mmetsp:Transcript_61971/g.115871  ORF Transcript_61971/g.115871 Transcript_61971/m.115871 type:complete len:134 (-) Transcript_61971:217-618(-)
MDEQPQEQEGGYLSWIGLRQPATLKQKPSTAEQSKAQKYATQMLAFDRVINNWRNRSIDKREALVHCDHILENIVAIGALDGDMARQVLCDRGLDDQRRVELQTSYQDLKQACGHKVPQYTASTFQRQQNTCC